LDVSGKNAIAGGNAEKIWQEEADLDQKHPHPVNLTLVHQ